MTNIPDVQRAIEYIESHLADSMNIGEVADHVGFSKYHFTRVFKDLTGFKPSEYYKGRKVTEAVNYMLRNECRIIDAAFEFGFNSPEVFTRSCLSAFNMSPSQIKKSVKDNHFKGMPAITPSSLSIYQKMKSFEAEETHLPAMLLKGYTYTSDDFFPNIGIDNSAVKELISGYELIYHLHWKTEDRYHHLIGVPVDLAGLTDDDFDRYIYKRIPEHDYLLFPFSHEGKERKTMCNHIFDNYLPSRQYRSNKTFAVEAVKVIDGLVQHSAVVYVPFKNGERKK